MIYFLSTACTYTEDFKDGKQTYTFTGPCLKTGKMCSVTVNGPDLYKYHKGTYIQDAFPYLSSSDREFLMSGYSAEGWDLMFKDEEEKDI